MIFQGEKKKQEMNLGMKEMPERDMEEIRHAEWKKKIHVENVD